MTGREIAHRRMRAQRLWGTPLGSPQEVVEWLGAVQSQELGVAKWSVAQRAAGVDLAAVDRALAEGAILRTHVLRPTWHFVSSADLRWLMRLSGPRVKARNAPRCRELGLDEALLFRTNELIARAVEGGRHLTRAELAAALDAAGIDVGGQRLPYIVMRAELDAVVCSGAARGKQQTYAAFGERVPPGPTLEREEALAELTWRYFRSHGPATLKDFLWWSGLTAVDARRGLDVVGGRLERAVVDGRTYWFAPASDESPPASPFVELAQGYDECLVAYSESRDAVGSLGGPLIGAFLHAILLDGRVVGYWRQTLGARWVAIETQLGRPLDEAEQRALVAAAERYGRFVGLPATVRSAR